MSQYPEIFSEFVFPVITETVKNYKDGNHGGGDDDGNELEKMTNSFTKAFTTTFFEKVRNSEKAKFVKQLAMSTWNNSLMEHKGGGEAYMEFFNSKSTTMAWMSAQTSCEYSFSPSRELDDFADITRGHNIENQPLSN